MRRVLPDRQVDGNGCARLRIADGVFAVRAAVPVAVERVSPGPYVELFARVKRDGWHAWGNEVESDVALA